MSNKLFLNSINNIPQSIPPIWFMRQAGRYHSHYRNLKSKHTFEELCKNPELSAEVARGPIKEFDYDVAILFSDILFALEGLGLDLKFDPGPKFKDHVNFENYKKYSDVDQAINHLQFQAEAIKITKQMLPESKSLIGFVGGPWTLVRYAIGKEKFSESDTTFSLLLIQEVIKPLLIQNIKLQLNAGAEIVMIFDSFLYDLPISKFLHNYINVLIEIALTFPFKVGYYSRGKSETELLELIDAPFAGMGFDHTISLTKFFAKQAKGFIQGNFNENFMLLTEEDFLLELDKFINEMKKIENRNGWVCGLGHGINKMTPEKNVHLFIEKIRKNFN